MLRMEVFDQKGQYFKQLSISDHIHLAQNKKGIERIRILEQAAFIGCNNLELYHEIIRWHVDKSGEFRKAYCIGTLAPKARVPPPDTTCRHVYEWEFDAYFALAAYNAGFHEEAFRIQKRLLYSRIHSNIPVLGWLIRGYSHNLQHINKPIERKYFINDIKKPSKMAVLYIGQYRTFDRTYHNIRENFLDPNDAIPFVFCETKMDFLDFKKKIREKWGEIGACEVVPHRPDEYKHIVEYLLKTKVGIHPSKMVSYSTPPSYVTSGGSILEYYYYMRCYELMMEYEKKHNVKFDIIVRSRLDILIGHKMEIVSFFQSIDEPLREKMDNDNLYLNNLGNGKIAELNGTKLEKKRYDDLLGEINRGNYIWTLGPNQVWIGKRHIMSQLYSLIYTYGKYDDGQAKTFNSETQFHCFCEERNMHHFWIGTAGGGKYLASRSKNGELLKSATDEVEDDTIVWTFVRDPAWTFTEN